MQDYGITVDTKELDEFCNHLDGIADDLMKKLKGETGYQIREVMSLTAKELSPKKTTNLLHQIDTAGTGFAKEDGTNAVDIGIISNAYYSLFLEYGTGYKGLPIPGGGGHTTKKSWVYRGDDGEMHIGKPIDPQPFMTPALNDNIPNIEKILSGAVDEVFE